MTVEKRKAHRKFQRKPLTQTPPKTGNLWNIVLSFNQILFIQFSYLIYCNYFNLNCNFNVCIREMNKNDQRNIVFLFLFISLNSHIFCWPDYSLWFIWIFCLWIFQVCKPRMLDGSNCSDAINLGRYIEDFTCAGTNASARVLKEMRLSFPSGHSSFSFYTMLFCAVGFWVLILSFSVKAEKLELTVSLKNHLKNLSFSPRFTCKSEWSGKDRNSLNTLCNLSYWAWLGSPAYPASQTTNITGQMSWLEPFWESLSLL